MATKLPSELNAIDDTGIDDLNDRDVVFDASAGELKTITFAERAKTTANNIPADALTLAQISDAGTAAAHDASDFAPVDALSTANTYTDDQIAALLDAGLTIEDLTAMTAGYVAGDELFYWDHTNSVLKSIDMTHLIAAVLALGRPGLTALTALAGSGVATDDELLIADTSATAIKKMLVSELKIALATTLGLVSVDKIFDAKGDLAVGTGADASSKLTVGSDGTVLIADSGQTAGLRYGDPNSLVQGINAQTGTTYTIATTDPGQLITCTNASAITVTVPQDSAVTFAIGKWCEVMQLGAGLVTVSAGSGATLRATPTAKARAQYSRMFLQKIAANTWHLAGDIAAT